MANAGKASSRSPPSLSLACACEQAPPPVAHLTVLHAFQLSQLKGHPVRALKGAGGAYTLASAAAAFVTRCL